MIEIATPFLWEGKEKSPTDFQRGEASWLECITGGMSSEQAEWGVELYLSYPIQIVQ